MALDEALAKAGVQLDEVFASSVENYEGLLIEKGATDEELAREMAIAERTRVEERARVLARAAGDPASRRNEIAVKPLTARR